MTKNWSKSGFLKSSKKCNHWGFVHVASEFEHFWFKLDFSYRCTMFIYENGQTIFCFSFDSGGDCQVLLLCGLVRISPQVFNIQRNFSWKSMGNVCKRLLSRKHSYLQCFPVPLLRICTDKFLTSFPTHSYWYPCCSLKTFGGDVLGRSNVERIDKINKTNKYGSRWGSKRAQHSITQACTCAGVRAVLKFF